MNLRNIKTEDINAELQRRKECLNKPKMNLIVVGPPGSGKGTQAPIIKDELCLCHLSTGDLLRDAVAKGTPLGKEVEGIMKRGELVSDEICVGLVKENLNDPECINGVLLDGTPRTLN